MKRLCSILGVSWSSFYYWRRTAGDRAARQAADTRLTVRIRAVHLESDGTYGAPRITAELRETGAEAGNHKHVARLMRASGIEGVRLRRRHRTTVPDPAAARAPDLIGRNFTARTPNTKYVGDITCLPIDGGKLCSLATVIDLASRRLASWAIAVSGEVQTPGQLGGVVASSAEARLAEAQHCGSDGGLLGQALGVSARLRLQGLRGERRALAGARGAPDLLDRRSRAHHKQERIEGRA
ncbi:IS3 family transposase [Streptomyces sp. NPDC005227]|uniref:IS3 family transposase n=1 Tax=Streptomyces sp. NPDC005227 TaxID=3364707 RepID=UPI00368BB1C2